MCLKSRNLIFSSVKDQPKLKRPLSFFPEIDRMRGYSNQFRKISLGETHPVLGPLPSRGLVKSESGFPGTAIANSRRKCYPVVSKMKIRSEKT
jgi:hypothetical protein